MGEGTGNAIVSLFHCIPDISQFKMLSTSSKYGIIRANLLSSDLTFSARRISTSSQAAPGHRRAAACVTICKEAGDGHISRDSELCTLRRQLGSIETVAPHPDVCLPT